MHDQVSEPPTPGLTSSDVDAAGSGGPAASASGEACATGRGRAVRWELYAFLELSALCGLAVAQPLLDAIGRSPEFLLFHGAGRADTLLLIALVVLVPPLLLWALSAVTRPAGATTRRVVHAVLVGALCAVFAVQVGKHTTALRGIPLAVLAALAGALAGVAYARLSVVGQALRVAAAGPLAFVLLFVFASPASAVVLGGGAELGGGRETGPHPPIVVIVLDELPLTSLLDAAGRVDAARLPHFARLAAASTWYRNATAVSPNTTFAVPAMLTGRYPTGELAPHYSRYPDNLFTLLGGAYEIQAWETVTRLCPPRYCPERRGHPGGGLPVILRESASLLGQLASPYDGQRDPTAGFRETIVADEKRGEAPGSGAVPGGGPAPGASAAVGPDFRMDRLADNQPARFTDFLAELPSAGSARTAGQRPVLRFLHLLIPHSPWLYLSSGIRYDGPGDLPFDGPWWARLAYQRHMQQVAYADRLLGEALDALERSGRYDESLVVVTSDHGDSFSEGVSGRDMDTGQRAAAEVAWVPLFIKEPGQRAGRVDDRNWQHVDLLPTLADHAGMEPSWRVDGVSAVRQRRTDPGKRFDQEPGTPMALRAGEHFPAVLRGPAARPVLPDVPEFALIGRKVTDLPVSRDGPAAVVANAHEFVDVRPGTGRLPALVDATLAKGPDRPATGTPVAIAVNGRIGAVALAAEDGDLDLRVVGLITDDRLFAAGANTLELYVVTGAAGSWRLRACRSGSR